jgi:hypothetical protein
VPGGLLEILLASGSIQQPATTTSTKKLPGYSTYPDITFHEPSQSDKTKNIKINGITNRSTRPSSRSRVGK